MPALFCTQSDRVSAGQSRRLAHMKRFYNLYQQQCFAAQRIFFQPQFGFMAPHQSRSLEGGFCSLSSIFFFSSLTCSVFQRRSDFKDRISSPQFQFLPRTTQKRVQPPHSNFYHGQHKKEYNQWRNAHTHTHIQTHTHLHTQPSHGVHRPHVCTLPPFCSTNGKICRCPQASNLKHSPLEHLWHLGLAQVQGFWHLQLAQVDQVLYTLLLLCSSVGHALILGHTRRPNQTKPNKTKPNRGHKQTHTNTGLSFDPRATC